MTLHSCSMPSRQLRIRAVDPNGSVMSKSSCVPMRKAHEIASASRCCQGISGTSFHCNNPRICCDRSRRRFVASSTTCSKRLPGSGGGGGGAGAEARSNGAGGRGAEGTATPRPKRMSASESRGIPAEIHQIAGHGSYGSYGLGVLWDTLGLWRFSESTVLGNMIIYHL